MANSDPSDFNRIIPLMAIVINPALSMDASGNVGGICYANWRGLHIARAARTGTVTSTAAQLVYQGKLTTLSRYWSGTLNATQRNRWIDFARTRLMKGRLSRRYRASGYQWFMKLNLQRAAFGGSPQNSPPQGVYKYQVTGITTVSLPASGYIKVQINIASYSVAPAYYNIQKAGPFDNIGRTAQRNEYRQIYGAVSPNYVLDYAVLPNKYYWYRCRGVNLYGVVGNWFLVQVKFA